MGEKEKARFTSGPLRVLDALLAAAIGFAATGPAGIAWPVPILLTLIGLRVRSTILFRGIAVAGVLIARLVLLALAGPFAGLRTFGTLVGAFMLLAR